MNIVQLSVDQYRQTIPLSEYAFQYKVSEDAVEQRLQNMKNHQIFAIWDDDVIAAKLHLLPFEIYFGDATLRMGGIAGVATYPEYRRNGYAKQLLLHTLRHMKEAGYSVSILHPFSVPFYRRYGWELLTDRMKHTLTKSDLAFRPAVSGRIRRYTKATHPKDVADVYEAFARQHPGMLVRTTDWWNRVYDDLTAAVYYTEEGAPQGYLLYEVAKSKMTVEEFIALTPEAYTGLWNFICQHDSMLKEVEIITHRDDPLAYTLQEPRVKTEVVPYGMVRIVDVKSFLANYPFRWDACEEPLMFNVTDAAAPWNLLTVRFDGRTVTCVEPVDAIDFAGQQLSVDINALSAALFGYKRPWQLYLAGKISGPEEDVRRLDALIPPLSPYLYDYF